ncbi:MAG TPA: DUF1499 domain-containing protein [Nevskiaceae bacterium]|nr:DUF1499 domain-containing protein [Nevskiaceae bacterium]
MFKFHGRRPDNLGVRGGRLAGCAGRSNCVCSQEEAEVTGELGPRHVRPFTFTGNPWDAMTRLVAVLLAQPRARIVSQSRDYVHAEFESAFFGFVDDVEFLLDPAAQLIHVRSASRLGLSDFGVNRARVEDLRVAFDEAE